MSAIGHEPAAELTANIAFWLARSRDEEEGGFFSCLDRTGRIYDERKSTWHQSRLAFVLALGIEDGLLAAECAADAPVALAFVERVAPAASPERGAPRLPYLASRDGRPLTFRDDLVAETLFAMASLRLGRVSHDPVATRRGASMARAVVDRWLGGAVAPGFALAGRPPDLGDLLCAALVAAELPEATGRRDACSRLCVGTPSPDADSCSNAFRITPCPGRAWSTPAMRSRRSLRWTTWRPRSGTSPRRSGREA